MEESLTSGEPIAGEPGSGTLGSINSSALEQSNVNLTNELVDLISAQRNSKQIHVRLRLTQHYSKHPTDPLILTALSLIRHEGCSLYWQPFSF